MRSTLCVSEWRVQETGPGMQGSSRSSSAMETYLTLGKATAMEWNDTSWEHIQHAPTSTHNQVKYFLSKAVFEGRVWIICIFGGLWGGAAADESLRVRISGKKIRICDKSAVVGLAYVCI